MRTRARATCRWTTCRRCRAGSAPARSGTARTADEVGALELDRADPLSALRERFAVPPWPGGRQPEYAYLAGNSLGLAPRTARSALGAELDRWESRAVEAWFEEPDPWLGAAERLCPALARLAGALPHEVVAMSSLTVNLHLVLAALYRPAGQRRRILIEDTAFPSDSYAAQTQAAWHGLDPADAVTRAPVAELGAALGPDVAVALLPAVNYLSGELLDVPGLTARAHDVGALVVWDLAHAIGNVPLSLHDWNADAAVWCSYKYLNAGPGAPGGTFVHERHAGDPTLVRLGGWWGNDPAERFLMEPGFVPRPDALGFAVSTPSVLGLAPLAASLALFDEAGLPALRERSLRLTGYLEELLAPLPSVRVATPGDPGRRGCQLSLSVAAARNVCERLRDEHGVIGDFREPDVLRLAPVPLYNTFHDCWRATTALARVLDGD